MTDPRVSKRHQTGLTHLRADGSAHMVDVSAKDITVRSATAAGRVLLSAAAVAALREGTVPKGDALSVSRIAAIQAAKRTPDLIPLCHPLALTDLVVAITPDRAEGVLRVRAEAATTGPTGVEMEAMTAASIAALTVYDMVKGVERGVEIRAVRLLSKTGGKSGTWEYREDRPADAAPTPRPRPRPGDRSAGRVTSKRKRSG